MAATMVWQAQRQRAVADGGSTVAAIVATSDPDRLQRCLQALARQARPPDEVFVLVPDVAPSAMGPGLPVGNGGYVLSQQKLGGVVGAQNAALCYSQSEFVYFHDDSFVPGPACIAALLDRFRADGVAAAVPRISWHPGPLANGAALGRIAGSRVDCAAPDAASELAYQLPLNAMFRRDDLLRVGGLDPTVPRTAAAVDLLTRLREGGARVTCEPRAVVVARERDLLRGLLRARCESLAPRAALEAPARLIGDVMRSIPRWDMSPTLRMRIGWFLYALSGPPSTSPLGVTAHLWRCLGAAFGLWRSTGAPASLAGRTGLAMRLLACGAGQVLGTFTALWLANFADFYGRRRFVRQVRVPRTEAPAFIPRRTLSACLITQNQEALLPVALGSVRDWVDEIVVVDGGSTDRSVEVCESFGARVVRHPWPGSYSLQRNVYLREARSDWIIVVDSDECFAPTAGDIARRLVRESKADLIWILRKWLVLAGKQPAVVLGKGIYPDMQPRLFMRERARGYVGTVHESLRGFGPFEFRASDITLYHLDLAINSRADRRRKLEAYERRLPGWGLAWHYLWEDYDYATRPVPWSDLPPAARVLLAQHVERQASDIRGLLKSATRVPERADHQRRG